jgi:formylglycine-generating enzyme required for sulfatase activity
MLFLRTSFAVIGLCSLIGCAAGARRNEPPPSAGAPTETGAGGLNTVYAAGAKLVVPPFENRGTKLPEAELENLRDYLISAFIKTGRFQVPDRDAMDLLFEEHRFQLSDWADEQKSAEMGRMLNADYIARVIVTHDGKTNLFVARILDVKTARGLSAAEMEFTNQRDAREKMEDFAGDILQRTGGGGQPAPASRPASAPATRPAPRLTGRAPKGFVLVEGGTFMMGNSSNELEAILERPQHQVTVSSFYMGKYEVTQREWRQIMGNNPSSHKGDKLPVVYVSWYEAIEYCNRRSVKEKLTPCYRGSGDSITCDFNANGYRLPTEAEWEYAAKGGNKNFLTYLYAGSNNVDAVAWYKGNSEIKPHPVGTKAPNELGIHDLSGNVLEWCWDWFGDYGNRAQTDPAGPSSGFSRIWRGGGVWHDAWTQRSSNRGVWPPSAGIWTIGFRLVRSR